MYIHIYIYANIFMYINRLGCADGGGSALRSSHCKNCNSLQHTATHCNTLQHTATHNRLVMQMV